MPPWRDFFSSSHASPGRSQHTSDNNGIYLPTPSRLNDLQDPSITNLSDQRSPSQPRTGPLGGRSTHGRSISQTLQATLGGRKKSHGDQYLSSSHPAELGSSNMQHRHGDWRNHHEEDDTRTGKCSTCGTRVKWPKRVNEFRCGTCLMINDLRSLGSSENTSTEEQSHHRQTDRVDDQGESRVSFRLEDIVKLEHRCITSYEDITCGSRRTKPPQTSTLLSPHLHDLSIEEEDRSGRSSQLHLEEPSLMKSEKSVRGNETFSGSPAQITLAELSEPVPRSQHATLSRSDIDQTLSPSPQLSHDLNTVSNPSCVARNYGVDSARTLSPHTTTPGSQIPRSNSGAGITPKDVRHIFKPLEDYIITRFSSFVCMNNAFYSARPKLPNRVKSEGDGPSKPTDHFAAARLHGSALPEVDAKTLMLGDIAENGLWWTGKEHSMLSPQSTLSRQRSHHLPVSSVSSRSPNIDWSELNDCYAALVNVGKSSLLLSAREIASNNSTDVHSSDRKSADLDLAEARLHVHKTILKASENLLKRPGRPINTPSDMRFLLILLANPLLYPPGSPPFVGCSQRSPSQDGSHTDTPLLLVHSDSAWERGHAYGVIKRVLGLLSNLSDECHQYLTSWLSKLDERRFYAITDMLLGFINHRMRRQVDRTPRGNVKPTIGLIPTLSGSVADTSAQLNAATGLGPTTHRMLDKKKGPPVYSDDWQIRAAARIFALIFAANKRFYKGRRDARSNHGLDTAVAKRVSRTHIKNHGQLLSTSYFYNSMVDLLDLVADFETWESKSDRFSFCQYPFLLSVQAKIRILEHDARRQMDMKAREAFFDNLLKNQQLNQYITFRVRRDCLVDDSLKGISQVVGTGQDEFKKELKIEFVGEEGIDVGGLRKEWFLSLVREIFDPHYGLFAYDDDSNFCYFNPHSFEASEQFHLVGALLGLAIYNSTILDVNLPPFLFKKLLSHAPAQRNKHIRSGMHLTLEDLAELHPRLARGLQQLLDYDGDVESTYCRDFTIEIERYGHIERLSLGPNASRPVTNENRQEFVDLYIRFLLDIQVSRQFEPFKRGFFTVCGGNALSLFQPEEIELLIRGSDEPLDVLSLKAVAVYQGFRSRKDAMEKPEDLPLIQWFWESFENASPSDQRLLLSFVTGSDRVPAAGEVSLKFKIGFAGPDATRYPIAHTCFNSILLYKYRSREELERMLWTAVRESEGFGLK